MKAQKNIQLTGSDGKPMLTDICFEENGKRKPVIIYLHGFNGFKDWGNFDLVAEQFAAAGFVFVKFNLSHGGTGIEQPQEFTDLEAYGNNNYSKELHDLQVVIDWVRTGAGGHEREMDVNKVALLGHSRGGGIVLIKAAEETAVKAVATWASVAECKTPWGSWAEEKMNEWKKTGVAFYVNGRTQQKMPLYYQLYQDYAENEDRLNIEKAIATIKNPILICHGKEDPAVPVEKAVLLKSWQPAAQLFLTSGDHVFCRKHPWHEQHLPAEMKKVVETTISFYKKSLQVA